MRKIVLVVVIFAVSFSLQAQDWEVGGWLGTSHYFGDLQTEYTIENPHLAGGVLFRYNFNRRLALKIGANYGKVSADDANSLDPFARSRNLSFQSNIFDGSMQVEFNFLKYVHGSKDENFTPYLFGGVALFNFNPKAWYNGDLVELQPLGTEGQFRGDEYTLTTPAIVYGGGFKFDVSYDWSINIELSARRLFTDYLDDVSTIYPDLDELEENRGPLAVVLADRSIDASISEPGRQRGNSQDMDTYMFFKVSLVYSFAQVLCPWFK